MSKKENQDSKKKANKAEEPKTAFKTVRFFDSFEEENEDTAKQRAATSYDERMKNIETLRKRVFNEHLLANGKWPSISNTFKIMDPYVGKTGQ
jgi:hypothetical protein